MSDRSAEVPPERPNRYNRSFGGLLAAMLVTVVLVAGYVGVRALFREQPDVERDVDYLSCVAYLQDADVTVVHPARLPEGWRANSIHFDRGAPPAWRMGVVTADEQFVGVVQQQGTVDDLVATYVDEAAVAGGDASPANGLGVAVWQTWSDAGGDHGFSAEPTTGPLAGDALLVYGSADLTDLERFLGSLTLDPVGSEASATSCDTDELQ